jgi:hypothetical protein
MVDDQLSEILEIHFCLCNVTGNRGCERLMFCKECEFGIGCLQGVYRHRRGQPSYSMCGMQGEGTHFG